MSSLTPLNGFSLTPSNIIHHNTTPPPLDDGIIFEDALDEFPPVLPPPVQPETSRNPNAYKRLIPLTSPIRNLVSSSESDAELSSTGSSGSLKGSVDRTLSSEDEEEVKDFQAIEPKTEPKSPPTQGWGGWAFSKAYEYGTWAGGAAVRGTAKAGGFVVANTVLHSEGVQGFLVSCATNAATVGRNVSDRNIQDVRTRLEKTIGKHVDEKAHPLIELIHLFSEKAFSELHTFLTAVSGTPEILDPIGNWIPSFSEEKRKGILSRLTDLVKYQEGYLKRSVEYNCLLIFGNLIKDSYKRTEGVEELRKNNGGRIDLFEEVLENIIEVASQFFSEKNRAKFAELMTKEDKSEVNQLIQDELLNPLVKLFFPKGEKGLILPRGFSYLYPVINEFLVNFLRDLVNDVWLKPENVNVDGFIHREETKIEGGLVQSAMSYIQRFLFNMTQEKVDSTGQPSSLGHMAVAGFKGTQESLKPIVDWLNKRLNGLFDPKAQKYGCTVQFGLFAKDYVEKFIFAVLLKLSGGYSDRNITVAAIDKLFSIANNFLFDNQKAFQEVEQTAEVLNKLFEFDASALTTIDSLLDAEKETARQERKVFLEARIKVLNDNQATLEKNGWKEVEGELRKIIEVELQLLENLAPETKTQKLKERQNCIARLKTIQLKLEQKGLVTVFEGVVDHLFNELEIGKDKDPLPLPLASLATPFLKDMLAEEMANQYLNLTQNGKFKLFTKDLKQNNAFLDLILPFTGDKQKPILPFMPMKNVIAANTEFKSWIKDQVDEFESDSDFIVNIKEALIPYIQKLIPDALGDNLSKTILSRVFAILDLQIKKVIEHISITKKIGNDPIAHVLEQTLSVVEYYRSQFFIINNLPTTTEEDKKIKNSQVERFFKDMTHQLLGRIGLAQENLVLPEFLKTIAYPKITEMLGSFLKDNLFEYFSETAITPQGAIAVNKETINKFLKKYPAFYEVIKKKENLTPTESETRTATINHVADALKDELINEIFGSEGINNSVFEQQLTTLVLASLEEFYDVAFNPTKASNTPFTIENVLLSTQKDFGLSHFKEGDLIAKVFPTAERILEEVVPSLVPSYDSVQESLQEAIVDSLDVPAGSSEEKVKAADKTINLFNSLTKLLAPFLKSNLGEAIGQFFNTSKSFKTPFTKTLLKYAESYAETLLSHALAKLAGADPQKPGNQQKSLIDVVKTLVSVASPHVKLLPQAMEVYGQLQVQIDALKTSSDDARSIKRKKNALIDQQIALFSDFAKDLLAAVGLDEANMPVNLFVRKMIYPVIEQQLAKALMEFTPKLLTWHLDKDIYRQQISADLAFGLGVDKVTHGDTISKFIANFAVQLGTHTLTTEPESLVEAIFVSFKDENDPLAMFVKENQESITNLLVPLLKGIGEQSEIWKLVEKYAESGILMLLASVTGSLREQYSDGNAKNPMPLYNLLMPVLNVVTTHFGVMKDQKAAEKVREIKDIDSKGYRDALGKNLHKALKGPEDKADYFKTLTLNLIALFGLKPSQLALPEPLQKKVWKLLEEKLPEELGKVFANLVTEDSLRGIWLSILTSTIDNIEDARKNVGKPSEPELERMPEEIEKENELAEKLGGLLQNFFSLIPTTDKRMFGLIDVPKKLAKGSKRAIGKAVMDQLRSKNLLAIVDQILTSGVPSLLRYDVKGVFEGDVVGQETLVQRDKATGEVLNTDRYIFDLPETEEEKAKSLAAKDPKLVKNGVFYSFFKVLRSLLRLSIDTTFASVQTGYKWFDGIVKYLFLYPVIALFAALLSPLYLLAYGVALFTSHGLANSLENFITAGDKIEALLYPVIDSAIQELLRPPLEPVTDIDEEVVENLFND